jgi:hypothetical protein
MKPNQLLGKRAAAILFSLIGACLLGLGGLFVGSYLWDRLGPPANDPDDMDAYLCGLLVCSVMAIGGFGALLWKVWPRAKPKPLQSGETRASVPD